MWRYDLNGLCVECDIPLSHGRPTQRDSSPDLTVHYSGERLVPDTVAAGTLMQGVASPAGLLYTTVRRDDGSVMLRMHRRVDFEIAADYRCVRVRSDPRCDPEMLGIFIAGNMLATVLALRGETVLHASAVEVGGAAVAFVADSGVGKSTLAALACTRGARFVTDDVLRTHHVGDTVRCWPGATENRLRRDVAALSTDLMSAATRTSADGRCVWWPRATTLDTCTLCAIVLPRPDRTHSELAMRRLDAGAALLELSRRPRLLGWSDERVVTKTFENLASLVRAVPVYSAAIPWGPPFDDVVIDTLLTHSLGARHTSSGRGDPLEGIHDRTRSAHVP